VILLDTSILVEALTGRRRAADGLGRAIERGERLAFPALVLYEWLRGPRTEAEIADQEALLPGAGALAFGATEALVAARLYREVPRARHRELDLAIAACALAHDAQLWTSNERDFRDVPGLRLYAPTVP
jgi:tRNA(fMet)-specific endonuclease VapC